MDYSAEGAEQILSRTPAVLRALLAGLPSGWTGATERPGSWSPFDVLAHLIHGERTDWIPRARLILEHGTSRAFEPFDMQGHVRCSAGQTVEQLLDEFERLRALNVAALSSMGLTEEDFARQGVHPQFGLVTLGQHLATWVVHDLDHVCQVARVMAKQYKDEVGPWIAYLGVLHDREPNS
jgi:hypothetical protein